MIRNERKASESQGVSNCVRVGEAGRAVSVRDSKRGEDSPVLMFRVDAWKGFVEMIKSDV